MMLLRLLRNRNLGLLAVDQSVKWRVTSVKYRSRDVGLDVRC
jgi:hypothetical protein